MSEERGEDVKYCSDCGQQLSLDAKFCERCGSNVVDGGNESADSTSTAISWIWSAVKVIAGLIVLLIVASILYSFFLGLTGQGTAHELVGGDAWETTDTQTGLTEQSLSGTATLENGQYIARNLEPSRGVNVDIEVDTRSGGPVDVFVIRRSNFEDYREKSEFVFSDSLSGTDINSRTLSGQLSAGDYVFVIDNSDAYGASPSGTAVVDATVRVSI